MTSSSNTTTTTTNTLSVVSFKTLRDKRGKEYTSYIIQIGLDENSQPVVFEKRFSEFHNFHESLKRLGYEFDKFPSKFALQKMSQGTTEERRILFHSFLNDLCSRTDLVISDGRVAVDRSKLIDDFLYSTPKKCYAQLASSLLQSVFDTFPEVRTAVQSAVISARHICPSMPEEELEFITKNTPVSLALTSWGNICFENSSKSVGPKRYQRLVEALYLYNLALSLAQRFEGKDGKDIVIDLFSKLNQFLTNYKERSLLSIENFWKHRDAIIELRSSVERELKSDPHKAKDSCQKITHFFQDLVTKMIIPDAPCDFCIISAGSMGRKEMAPFSDFEFVILLNSDDDLSKHKDWFIRMNLLLEWQIINLGETVKPAGVINPFGHVENGYSLLNMLEARFWLVSGFRFDTGNLNPTVDSSEYITTPERLMRTLSPEIGGDMIVRSSLRFPGIVAGSKQIYDRFMEMRYLARESRLPDELSRLKDSLVEMRDFVEAHRLLRSNSNKPSAYVLDVKADLYRIYHSLVVGVAHVALLPSEIWRSTGENHHAWNLLELMKSKEIINSKTHKLLSDALDLTLSLRMRVQLFYRSEEEKIYPDNTESGISNPKFCLNDDITMDVEKVMTVSTCLMNLIAKLESEASNQSDYQWTIDTSDTMKELKNLDELVSDDVESSAEMLFKKKDYLTAVKVFRAALESPIATRSIEKKKSVLKRLSKTLILLAEESKSETESEEHLKKAQEFGDQLYELISNQSNSSPPVNPRLTSIEKSSTILTIVQIELQKSNKTKETIYKLIDRLIGEFDTSLASVKSASKDDLTVAELLLQRAKLLERIISKEETNQDQQNQILTSVITDLTECESVFLQSQQSELRYSAVQSLVFAESKRGNQTAAGKWKEKLIEIELASATVRSNEMQMKVYLEVLRSAAMALVPIVQQVAIEVATEYAKQEAMEKMDSVKDKCSIL